MIGLLTSQRMGSPLSMSSIVVTVPVSLPDDAPPGAVLVPLATVPDNVDAFRGDGPVYVICRSGGRSMKACEYVAAQGLEPVNVAGGTLAWIDSGRECSIEVA